VLFIGNSLTYTNNLPLTVSKHVGVERRRFV
jgi:hypothetical protein